MNKLAATLIVSCITCISGINHSAAIADNMDGFGDAEFPAGTFSDGPKSYHDAWCRRIKNKCRVRFQGPSMWVEGKGGITRAQLREIRRESDGYDEYYFYVDYTNKQNIPRTALFLFAHKEAAREFAKALFRFYDQDPRAIPNYRYPASQGPQETHGRDKSFGRNNNPYDNEPITDWSETTQPW
jgi:hypothetical protein